MKRTAIKAGFCAVALAASGLIPTTAHAEPAPVEAAPAAAPTGNELAGATVFLDPGHQGSAEGHDLAKQVPDGRGGTKDCQTTGMTSLGGVPEHTINWNVSEMVASSLQSLGATVVKSRQDDTGWGGCIDDRARAANESGADLAVSIHADSTSASADPVNHGFHMIVPTLPIPDAQADAAQSGPGRAASNAMRDAYTRNGMVPANYAGVVDGIQTRPDVAGPALTQVPLVFVEMGNGSNPEDAAVLENRDGQVKHAIAITTGIVAHLLTSEAVPAADSAEPAAATPPEPRASEQTPAGPAPESTDPGTGADGDLSQVLARVMELLEPLFDVGGVDDLQGLVNEENLGLVSDLASALLGTALGVME
ncbi:MAG: N-acetylmuramoyl-L-alanine amidase [Rhodococcus sp.]|nr:N-acetylmuramoyl-L-alanine amidase [Rhodococcus sp. (in: high G+C Gram-positive bacteria)]